MTPFARVVVGLAVALLALVPAGSARADEPRPADTTMQKVRASGRIVSRMFEVDSAGSVNGRTDPLPVRFSPWPLAVANTIGEGRSVYLALDAETVRSYPDRIRRLLGWSYTPQTYMGWVEIDGEMADPNRLLA